MGGIWRQMCRLRLLIVWCMCMILIQVNIKLVEMWVLTNNWISKICTLYSRRQKSKRQFLYATISMPQISHIIKHNNDKKYTVAASTYWFPFFRHNQNTHIAINQNYAIICACPSFIVKRKTNMLTACMIVQKIH